MVNYTFNASNGSILTETDVQTTLSGVTGLFTATIGSNVLTINNFCFRGLDLTSVTIPDTVESIGNQVFENCTYLSTADIHRYTNDNVNNEIEFKTGVFDSSSYLAVPLTVTVHSDSNWGNTKFGTNPTNHYRYVFYERDLTSRSEDLAIAEFEVWNANGTRISHTLSPTIIWSSQADSTTSNPNKINDGNVGGTTNPGWISAWNHSSIYDVFGNTLSTVYGTYKKSFIGYDFGSAQDIKKIALTANPDSLNDYRMAGTVDDINGNVNGYKLYFTNDIKTVTTTDNTTDTPGTYTCVDPDKHYYVTTSYAGDGVSVNTVGTNDIYTHADLDLPLGPGHVISLNYNILSGTTTIDANGFKDNTMLTSVTIPDTITGIGNNAFENCTNLSTVDMHRYTNDNVSNEIALGEGVFDSSSYSAVPLTITLHSNTDWETTLFGTNPTNHYQYVFYERDLTTNITGGNTTPNSVIAEFEVWNANGTRISHITGTDAPIIIWSSKADSTTWDPSNINDDLLTNAWHAHHAKQSLYDVFGNTADKFSGDYKKVYIGYNFGSVQDIKRIKLYTHASGSWDYRMFGTDTERRANINGYKLYFTNNIKTVVNTDISTYTPVTYTCVDQDKPYFVTTSYAGDGGQYQNFGNVKRAPEYHHANLTFMHEDLNLPVVEPGHVISLNYNIISGTTSIAANQFKDNTMLTSVTIPSTVTSIGANAFANCKNLSTAEIHRYSNNNPTTEITLGTDVFSNTVTPSGGEYATSPAEDAVPLTMTIHATGNWGNTRFNESSGKKFRYVYFERILDNEGAMLQFEVWNTAGTRISHITGNGEPTIVYSSKYQGYSQTAINDDILTHAGVTEWHTKPTYATGISAFGQVQFDSNKRRAFIGYDFGSPQEIAKIRVSACYSTHDTLTSKHYIHLTNDVHTVSTTHSPTYTPQDYTCIDPAKYCETIHYSSAFFDDPYEYDRYTYFLNRSSPHPNGISYNYNLLNTHTTAIATDAFKDNINLGSITIPDSVTSIGANAFDTLNEECYQYVFFEVSSPDENDRLDMCEIEIEDTLGRKISQNGKWSLNENTGETTTLNGDTFYYSGSYSVHTGTTWHASKVLNGVIREGVDDTGKQALLSSTYTNTYQRNCFSKDIETGHFIPYCVIKFNEPKNIGMIRFHARRYVETNIEWQQHNIYLANTNDVTFAENINNTAPTYNTPTIPYISGSNYKSIYNFTSNIGWNGFSTVEYSKTYRLRNNSNTFYTWQSSTDEPPIPVCNTHGIGGSAPSKLTTVTIDTTNSGLITIGDSAFKNSGLTSLTLPNGVNSISDNTFYGSSNLASFTFSGSNTSGTIGKNAFRGTGLTSIVIPESFDDIGDDAFDNCKKLSTAEIHRHPNDVVSNGSITLGTNIFNNPGVPLTIKIHSPTNWGNNLFTTNDYRYVFYERDLIAQTEDVVISEFEVWNTDGTRISHGTGSMAPTIIWSSKAYDNATDSHSYVNINTDNLTHSNEWHSNYGWQRLYDVFGNTSGWHKKPFIGYDFGSTQKIKKVVLTQCLNHHAHNDKLAGTDGERLINKNGYNLYFTNDIKTVVTTDDVRFTPVTYTYIDRDKPYKVISSYDYENTHTNALNDLYTHHILKDSIYYDYNIINNPTTIAANYFKDNDNLASVTIPKSVTTIGDYAFGNCKNLSTAEIHRYTDDGGVANLTTLGNNIFNNPGVPLRLNVHSGDTWNNARGNGIFTDNYYRYVYFERDSTTHESNTVITEFEVWNTAGIRISHTLSPTILWSSQWENTTTWGHANINNNSSTSHWHARVTHQNVYNVFGDTAATQTNPKRKAFIGYDFGSIQQIKEIKISSNSYGGLYRPGGDHTDMMSNRNGYKLYFTNDVLNWVNGNGDAQWNSNYTVVDRNKSYKVIDGNVRYNVNNIFDNGTGDLYIAHHDENNLLGNISYDYTIIAGTTTIATDEFKDNTRLTGITLPTSVATIGASAFEGATNLSSVTIPDAVTTIGASAFEGATNLSSVTIPDAVTTINANTFKNTSLTSITIPDTVTTIGANAFEYTLSMTSCTLPNNASFTDIPSNCFHNSGLTTVTIPDSVDSIGTYAFASEIIQKYQYVFIQSEASRKLHFAEIEIFDTDGVRISQNGNWILDHTAKTMTTTGGDNFYFSSSYIRWSLANQQWAVDHMVNGIISTTNSSADSGAAGRDSSKLAYLDDCFNNTIANNEQLPYVVFKFFEPKQIGKIITHSVRLTASYNFSGAWANDETSNHDIFLANEDAVSMLPMPSTHTADHGTYTPNEIPYINSINYTSILHSNSGINWGKTWNGQPDHQWSKTYNFSYPKNFTITEGIRSPLISCTLPNNDSLTTIADNCFRGSGLTSVTIPDTVISLGNSSFAYSGLTSITIPESVTTLGSLVFSNLGDLASFTIPNVTRWIGESTFTLTASVISSSGGLVTTADALLSVIVVDGYPATGLNDGTYVGVAITTTTSISGSGALATVVVSSGTVTGITVTTAGTGYVVDDVMKIVHEAYPITSLPIGCFQNSLKSLSGTTITIPYNITSIGAGAFTTTASKYAISTSDQLILKLPPAFVNDVSNSDLTKYDSSINLALDHFAGFKYNNSAAAIYQMEPAATDLSITGYNLNGTSLQNFRKGILSESDYCDYETASYTVLNTAFNATPYAVAGLTGFNVNGGDIGKRVAPYYKQYTTVGTTIISLLPNWTKLGILAIGGGGGGQSGHAQSGGGDWGGGGGGSGAMSFGYYSQSDIGTAITEVTAIIGAGGPGGGGRGNNGSGNSGGGGGTSSVALDSLNSKIITANGGGAGHGGGSSYGGGGGIGSETSISGTFFKTTSEDGAAGVTWVGYYQGGAGGSISPAGGGYDMFNFSELNGSNVNGGRGGAGGRGDLSTDYGVAGSTGDDGCVYIFQYFT